MLAPRSQASHTTTATGMGGVGKTLLAVSLMRDPAVGRAFEQLCWVSVGQEQGLLEHQQVLHRQLTGSLLPDEASTPEIAYEVLIKVAKDAKLLLILDDVWNASHLKYLFIADVDAGSAVVYTSRIHALLPGVTELQCDVLTKEESLELLLKSGGVESSLSDPSLTAVQAVELCGRLPLALDIAGGIMREMADLWESQLLQLLKEEFASVGPIEARIVGASLRAIPADQRHGTLALFTVFSCFPEDAIVPAAVLDTLAPLIVSLVVGGCDGNPRRNTRKWGQHLLKASLLRGSVEKGVSMHDLGALSPLTTAIRGGCVGNVV